MLSEVSKNLTVEQLMDYLTEAEQDVVEAKAAADEAYAAMKSSEQQVKDVRLLIQAKMIADGIGEQRVKGCLLKLRKKRDKLVIKNPDLIPADFYKEKTTKVLDRTALQNFVKDKQEAYAEVERGGYELAITAEMAEIKRPVEIDF